MTGCFQTSVHSCYEAIQTDISSYTSDQACGVEILFGQLSLDGKNLKLLNLRTAG